MKKACALALALAMLLGMVGTMAGAEAAAPSYTYNTSMGASPINWNPHAWEMSNENDFMAFIEAPMVDTTIAEDGVTFEWIYEMASAVTDVTADFADKEAWGLPADAAEHRVYQIDLNPNAKWEDGTPITADDYIYSAQALLDPAMKNYRANNYISGDSAILNAASYFNNDKVGEPIYSAVASADGYAEVEDADMYINAGAETYFFGDTFLAYYGKGYEDYYLDADGNDLYEKYKDLEGYVPLTDEIKQDLLTISANFGDTNEEAYKEYTFHVTGTYEETPWDQVGIFKTGEHQITYITENELTMFYMLSSLTSPWLVNKDLYEAGKKSVENLVATDYGTSMATYSATGPYKIASFEVDKQIVLVKNENWFGYTDGAHEGQYQATAIKIDIIGEHDTELLLFNQGNLDGVELTSDDMAIYRMSDNLQKTDQTYTFRFIFASDLDALKNLEDEANDGANKRVLYYDDFRKALSFAIDRATLTTQGTPGYKPAYYLLNYLYYTDIENDTSSQYRNTNEAKEAVLNLYGMTYGEGTDYATADDAFAAVTGYDVEEARALFEAVYEQALADGNYTEGQAININAMVAATSSLSADDTRQQDLLNQFVAEATKGTGFEDKITFKFASGSTTRYDDVAAGRVEMIRGAWGGAAFYPFSTIRVYCEPDYMGGLALIHESCGWDPTKEVATIVYDFDGDGTAEEVTDTLQNWAKSINGGGAYYGDADAQLKVLSSLETAILSSYQCIPWGTQTICSLYSYKINWATLDYNIMYGYGGVRLMTFNYTDDEWAEFVQANGGVLNYE